MIIEFAAEDNTPEFWQTIAELTVSFNHTIAVVAHITKQLSNAKENNQQEWLTMLVRNLVLSVQVAKNDNLSYGLSDV